MMAAGAHWMLPIALCPKIPSMNVELFSTDYCFCIYKHIHIFN